MYPPITSGVLGLFALVLLALLALVEVGAIEIAYHKLGMSHRAVIAILMASIFGSYINVPIASYPARAVLQEQIVVHYGIPYVVPQAVAPNTTTIAVNVGGALMPLMLSAYLIARFSMVLLTVIATLLVSLVVYHLSAVVPGVGIAVPTFIPGVLAALLAYLLDRRRAPAIAYVAGSLGCLLGADIYNLGMIADLQAPVASIGGAGTFDGVFVSGIIAVLLA